MKYGLAHDQSTHDEYLGQNQGNVICLRSEKDVKNMQQEETMITQITGYGILIQLLHGAKPISNNFRCTTIA